MRWLMLWTLLAAGASLTACTSHKVEVAPIEVKPIHMTVDINIKIDRELDEFFDFEDPAPVQAMPAEAPAQEGAQR